MHPGNGSSSTNKIKTDDGETTSHGRACATPILSSFGMARALPLGQPFLPQAALAAIIIVPVLSLIDLRTLLRVWRYSKADAACLVITFVVVLAEGIEIGLFMGIITSLVLYLWRTSRPHVAVVGRVGNSEHFRNVKRHKVRTCPHILAMRVDESLYFANANYLGERLLSEIVDRPAVRHVVLILSAINHIDASALESLENLVEELSHAGITLHLTEVKGLVMDRLKRTDFIDRLAPGQVFLSTHEAMLALGCS
jgi:Sulfate permease and related transporters (MFS superfamily)